MDFNLFKNLDKAFDELEKTVTDKVVSVVEPEFPDRNRPNTDKPVFVSTKGKSRTTLTQWQELDLEGRKVQWDGVLQQLKRQQEEAGARPAWQQRAQDAEHQLLQLLNVLVALPDPVPHMQVAAALPQRISELEASNKALQADAKRASEDTAEVQALVDRFHLLEVAHRETQEKLSSKDAEMLALQQAAGEAATLQQQLEERSAEAVRLQMQLRALRADYEAAQSQLFELSTRQEAAQGNSQVDLELLAEQLERSQQALRDLQSERQQLASQLEQLGAVGEEGAEQGGQGASPVEGRGTWRRLGGASAELLLEQQLAVKEQETAGLRRQLEQLRARLQDTGREQQLELDSVRSRLVAATAELEGLQRELARRPEPRLLDELQQQVASLQALLDMQLEQEGWSPGQAAVLLQAQGPPAVLQERNRKLSAELQALRQQLQQQEHKAVSAAQHVSQLQAQLAEQQQLVARLEEDLAASSIGTQRHSAASERAAAAQAAGALAAASAGELDRRPGTLHAHPLVLSRSPSELPSSPSALCQQPSLGSAAAAGGPPPGLLDIVVSQRDRFRARLVQLEEEKGALEAQLQESQRKLESCRADNIKLYEKIRYLEGFSSRQAGGGSAGGRSVIRVDEAGVSADPTEPRANRYRCGPLALEIGASSAVATAAGGGMRSRSKAARLHCFEADEAADEEAAGGPEARWGKAYEARINPFVEFQQHESQQRVQNLQLHDRAVLASSKVLMGSRVARVFVVSYAVLLHIFIMVLLYFSAAPAAASSSTYSGSVAGAAAHSISGANKQF